MRARRLIAAASVAALGVLSLAACGKSAPDVAAYVGDTSWSTARVDEIYDDLQAKYGEAVRQEASQAGATPSPDQLRSSVTRQDVLNLLISLELGKRVAAAKNVQVPDQVSPEELQQGLRVPAAAEYTRLWGEWIDVSQALSQQLPLAEQLSDDAVMAVYRAIAKTGAIDGGLSVDQVRQAFGDGGFVRAASALSAALQEEAERADIAVNPRFRTVGVPSVVSTGQALVFYSLPYIDQNGPVTDISTPEPLPSAEPAETAGTDS
ncbi:hypothetical protein [Micromonospora sp. WMMD812]|uniref:hypothetical protein n=1 Tax=Micromonospora sp. WMMD812 TaxID=3015152 RepID=UPI00248BA42C|nr:hypothetical protein [Micromonospora sp. WMMD812]WBB64967.1 hypothetical protein O7603_17205 [Micromonospora sp. WMMD812]